MRARDATLAQCARRRRPARAAVAAVGEATPPPPQPLLTQIIVNPCGDAAYNARVALSHAELGDETHLYSVELTCDDALRPLLDASNAGSAADVAAVTSAPPNAPPNTEAPS